MDYIDGTDAAQLMQQRYPAGMPADSALPIITAVASALDYAHKKGLLLFADVVQSMDIAVVVGAERLREVMSHLVNRAGPSCSGTAARWTSSPATASWRLRRAGRVGGSRGSRVSGRTRTDNGRNASES